MWETIASWTGLRAQIFELMSEVTSADKAYKALIEAGVEVTRASVRELWREVGEFTAWHRVIETRGFDKYVPAAWRMTGSPGMTTEFQHRWGVVGIQRETGELVEKYVAQKIDKPTPPADYENQLIDELNRYLRDLGITPLFYFYGGLWKRPS